MGALTLLAHEAPIYIVLAEYMMVILLKAVRPD